MDYIQMHIEWWSNYIDSNTLWYVVECAGARESVVHSLAFYFILKIGAKEKIYLYVCVCVLLDLVKY